jgi:hypothetical protein
MNRKKGLFAVVAALAISSVMAAMAYNSATVTNNTELKIVNTNKALLTLEANTPWSWQSTVGAKDNTVVVKDGELFVQFGKGVDRDGSTPRFYGLQPNSQYVWNPLFTLRNKSAETITVTVSATGTYAQYMTFGTMSQGGQPTWGTKGEPLTVANIPKETNSGMQNIRNIAVKIDLPSGVTVSDDILKGSIVVNSVAN